MFNFKKSIFVSMCLFVPFFCTINAEPIDLRIKLFAESVYKANLYINNEIEQDLNEEKATLEVLLKCKSLFQDYLYDNVNIKSSYQTNEYNHIKNDYLPLIKATISKIENHLEQTYGYKRKSHFSKIAKPIAYSAATTIASILIMKFLQKSKLIETESYKKLTKYLSIAGTTTAGLWILLNYGDQILRKKFNKLTTTS